MKATITSTLDMLERIYRFMLEHSFAAAVPRAAAAHGQLLAVVAALRAAAREQIGGRAESAGGVELREKIWRRLRDVLAGVNRTARVLEEDFPGIRAQFRLPRTRSYPALLASARAIVAAALPMQAAFIEAGHAPDFLEEINALLAAFEAATAQKHSGKILQVTNTAALKEQARLGIHAATKLDAYARNHFRDQPEMLAAWRHARHIERSPRRSIPQTTPPTAQPQSSEPPSQPSAATSLLAPITGTNDHAIRPSHLPESSAAITVDAPAQLDRLRDPE